MRIAHIVPVANHTPWFADISAETARQGHDVIAIIHAASGNLSERLTKLGIRHYRVPMHFAEDLDRARPLFYLLRLPLAALRVARILRRERIDVAHSHIFVMYSQPAAMASSSGRMARSRRRVNGASR